MGEQFAETNNETRKHIMHVASLLHGVVAELLSRADAHDLSKLSDTEAATFAEYTPKLAGCTYGSPEYKGYLEAMAPALENHYEQNRHHPEHFGDGINDMTLVDLIEMLCDWKAATLRHNDGDMERSLRHNKVRFGIGEQLSNILHNTAAAQGWLDRQQGEG